MADGYAGRPIELTGDLGELAQRVGSVTKLAELLGVSPRTVQRWNRGTMRPKGTAWAMLQTLKDTYDMEPTQGPITALIDAVGGLDHLARALNVSRRSIQRWNALDASPDGPARKMLYLLAQRHGVHAPFPLGQESPEPIKPGNLYDYLTGAHLRKATADETRASVEAARQDGGAGVILVDGTKCYVDD